MDYTKEYREMASKFPDESTVQIMARLGYKSTGAGTWYNEEKNLYGKTWVGWDTSRHQHSANRLFHGTGYKHG